jgi:hypothetical protein
VTALPTKQDISDKLNVLQALVDRMRIVCEEQGKNDDAWRFEDIALRLAAASANLDEQPYQDWNDKAHLIVSRLSFANERIAAAIREFEKGVECEKNTAVIIGYIDDVVRAIKRMF